MFDHPIQYRYLLSFPAVLPDMRSNVEIDCTVLSDSRSSVEVYRALLTDSRISVMLNSVYFLTGNNVEVDHTALPDSRAVLTLTVMLKSTRLVLVLPISVEFNLRYFLTPE
jgi:hypothetical protein